MDVLFLRILSLQDVQYLVRKVLRSWIKYERRDAGEAWRHKGQLLDGFSLDIEVLELELFVLMLVFLV